MKTESWVPLPGFSDSGRLGWGHMTCCWSGHQALRTGTLQQGEGPEGSTSRAHVLPLAWRNVFSHSVHLLTLSFPFLLHRIPSIHPYLSVLAFILFTFLCLIPKFYFRSSPLSFSCVLIVPPFSRPFFSLSHPYLPRALFPSNN